MTGENQPLPVWPELGHQALEGLFDVEKMSDDQIVMMVRSLGAMAATLRDEAAENDAVCDSLFDGLAADVRNLACRNPERVKRFLGELARSENRYDRELAVTTAGSLIDYDYLFTREVMLHIHIDSLKHQIHGDSVFDVSIEALASLVRNRLTPEQTADFNARLSFEGLGEI
ncbi:hypothetical protein ACH489_17865 [Streptomyces rubiginosohelvolus]